MRLVFDIEASGLLNDETIDYTASPYVLKDHYKFHCLVIKNIDTGEVLEYNPDTFKDGVEYIKANATTLIGHNIVDYDLLALKLGFDFDYTVYPDTICGRPCTIIDTLVLSKTLNPDRMFHSLDYLGKLAGVDKIDWRGKAIELGLIDSHAPKGEEFKVYHPAMLEYNRQDVEVNHKVFDVLMKEWGTWNWQPAFELEMAVRDIVTRQSHRGFYFDVEKAKDNVRELDILMQQAREIVEPLLPPSKLSAAKASETTPPKIQFKKDGTVSANMIKFAEKVGGAIDDKVFKWNGKDYQIPMPLTPLIDSEPASIEDTTHIKGWLVDLGWWPTVYKERDLTVDSKKKKLTKEKYKDAVERYMTQTMESPFKRDRMFHLTLGMKCKDEQVLSKLLSHDLERPMKVYTNPTFTVGQDKELCPKLEEMSEIFPHVYKVVEFLTYRHRRNSILGGGVGIDEDDIEMEKGYLANIRADGRIPTPADTCGCNTSRFKHRIVTNIPRTTSMYGKNMRAMFGVERKKYAQFGYDFSSLEGRMESHYCWKYDETKEYCNSLVLEKPFDVHTLTAKKISEILCKEFKRTPAKNVKYCCLPTDNTKVLTPFGWKDGTDIVQGDVVLGYDAKEKVTKWTKVTATHFYQDAEVIEMGNALNKLESTPDHRWYGQVLKQYGSGKTCTKIYEDCVWQTKDLKQTLTITNTAEFVGGESNVKPHEAALIAWLIADGHYKWSELSETTSCSGGARKGIIAGIYQASHTYQKEVEEVLAANNAEFVVDLKQTMNENTINAYRLKSKWIRDFLDRVVGSRLQKHNVNWTEWVVKLSKESLEAFVHHFWLADGDSKGNFNNTYKTIRQNEGNICDAISVACYLLGGNVTIRGNKRIKTVRMQNRRKHTTTQEFKVLSKRETDVFCLTTELDTFVIQQNGLITITGNCTYGGRPMRVAKTIGSDFTTGKQVYDAFWLAADPLRQLGESLKKYWETVGGKKFVLGIDGRKVPTRSASALVNSLLQSAGVICAKWTMVLHDRKLAAKGLTVDFFRDNWKNKSYINQMVAMHDEAQMEVSKGLIEWKIFKEEDEAIAFKKSSSDNWSEVGHIGGKWFVGKSVISDLLLEAVDETTAKLKLNIPLGVEFIYGDSWATCH